MGKKSREKRERKAAKTGNNLTFLLHGIDTSLRNDRRYAEFDKVFQKQVAQTKAVLQKYKFRDAAVALNVSDLWPANVASPVKHIFAWVVFLGLETEDSEALSISSYDDFKMFVTTLYEAWPEFEMLEDFTPEADWGHTKGRLASDFVPMFYGSCIERTPDFVESFRISYADNPAALADMDLSIAVQSSIIGAIPELRKTSMPQPERGHAEVPPEDFWRSCQLAILRVGLDVAKWRSASGNKNLEISFGKLKGQVTSSDFGSAVMQGMALPFLAVAEQDAWIPISVRSQPGVVIDYWANRQTKGFSVQAHMRLAQFVWERFPQTYVGPMTLMIGNESFDQLPISCIITSSFGLHLICACDHVSYEKASQASQKAYTALRSNQPFYFRQIDGRGLVLAKGNRQKPTADEIRIVIIITKSSTAAGTIGGPKPPARLMFLADFITIFDELTEPEELERFWKFLDAQTGRIRSFSGLSDFFACYIDTHGVLVDGATKPTKIMLDPHWGTTWRFNRLLAFWSKAPLIFPNISSTWHIREWTEGVTVLESRRTRVLGYSTQINSCTIQILVAVLPNLHISDGRMLDIFAQLLADSLYRNRDVLSSMPLFHRSHIVLNCEADPSSAINSDQPPKPLLHFPRVVITALPDNTQEDSFLVNISTHAVFSGLTGANDASFEIRCLIETLQIFHTAYREELSNRSINILHTRQPESARYNLNVVDRQVDVPDFPEAIIPSPKDYKLARKHLAISMHRLGLRPGRYELDEAKTKIDAARNSLRAHIESQLASFNRHKFIKACIEQHDAMLANERVKLQKIRLSLSHEVDYDRLEAAEEVRKEYGSAAQHYRYLLEKKLSTRDHGATSATDDELRELVGLVDWYKVLAEASDVLHNGVGVGGISFDDSYIPEIFYSASFGSHESRFTREYAKSRLGIDIIENDKVEGVSTELIANEQLRKAFRQDLGFELGHMLTAMMILSQAPRWGLGGGLSLSYAATHDHITQVFEEHIPDLGTTEANAIVKFLTLSSQGIKRLAGKETDENEVPYWEHNKRLQRYTIRPLVEDGYELRWGAETTSRAAYIWSASVRDGYLPADFNWPNITPIIGGIKADIEANLEGRAEEIFRRYTPYVEKNIDFFRKFRGEGFEDVGDFDVLAYWPSSNTLVATECKYNQPPYCIKDSRRLRDRIFGKHNRDQKGQYSKILRRMSFIASHRNRILELLNWPESKHKQPKNLELYISREVHYWMFHPPYDIPTTFIRVDSLDSWITRHLSELS